MAKAYLDSYHGEVTDLPEVCMKCGEAATLYKRRSFSWYPPWTAVLLLAGLLPRAATITLLPDSSARDR